MGAHAYWIEWVLMLIWLLALVQWTNNSCANNTCSRGVPNTRALKGLPWNLFVDSLLRNLFVDRASTHPNYWVIVLWALTTNKHKMVMQWRGLRLVERRPTLGFEGTLWIKGLLVNSKGLSCNKVSLMASNNRARLWICTLLALSLDNVTNQLLSLVSSAQLH